LIKLSESGKKQYRDPRPPPLQDFFKIIPPFPIKTKEAFWTIIGTPFTFAV
jgi:hypothetical protein